MHFASSVRPPRSRPANWDRRGIGAQHDGHRIRLARVLQRELAKIERAAAMREPSHDQFVTSDQLLAIYP
jgi:hypothetical protein